MRQRAGRSDPRVVFRGDSFSMRKIRPALIGVLVAGFLLGLTCLSGCSSEETGDVPAQKVSRRDEAGKKFPFPDAAPATKGAGGSGKTPAK
jgi:hypothetical protein